MDRNTRIILVAAGVIIAVISALLFQHLKHAPRKKIVIRKRAAAKEAAIKKLPQVQKNFSNPKIAIVMDDFGYNMSDLDTLFGSGLPTTLSILPDLPYSRRVSEMARSKGYEFILHLPLEPHDRSAPLEPDTIKTDMDSNTISSILNHKIAGFSGLKGVSNHQGSRATEDRATMSVILKDLKKRGLYYFDSLVTDKSVCRELTKEMRIPYAKRDMFLDNESSQEYIEKQVLALRRLAFRRGYAIGVCHDRKNTIMVLNRLLPLLSGEGVEFVPLSDMVK